MTQLLNVFLRIIRFVISTMSLSNRSSPRFHSFQRFEAGNLKILSLLFFLIPILFINCSTTVDPADVEIGFKIQIDSIKVADTVSLSDSVSIKFYGTVGPDGCHKFKMFDVVKGTNETSITVWGEKPNYDAICPAVMVYLNGKELKLKLAQTGNHTIKIYQPDGAVLIKSVYVK